MKCCDCKNKNEGIGLAVNNLNNKFSAQKIKQKFLNMQKNHAHMEEA